MLIIWGKQQTGRRLGFVAEFCPRCRTIRPFELVRLGVVSHLYFIPMSEDKLVDHIANCTACACGLSVDLNRYADSVARPPADIEELIRRTFPTLRAFYAHRLALEAKIKRTPSALTGEERAQAIHNAFALWAATAQEAATGETKLDWRCGLGCLGTVIVVAALLLTLSVFPWEASGTLVTAVLLAVLALGFVYTLFEVFRVPSRFIAARIVPLLACELAPLDPTSDELRTCLQRFKDRKLKIGSKVKVEQLLEELRRQSRNRVR